MSLEPRAWPPVLVGGGLAHIRALESVQGTGWGVGRRVEGLCAPGCKLHAGQGLVLLVVAAVSSCSV